jgi:hypothetical protein
VIKVEDIVSLKSGRPQVLTVNGKAELIVQEARSYQALLDALDHAEAVAGIRRGLEGVARGEGEDAGVVLEGLRKKLERSGSA